MNTSTIPIAAYFFQGLGVSVGIIAGFIVGYLINHFTLQSKNAQQVKNLKFELKLNMGKIDDLLGEVARYRNAIHIENLTSYFGYFDFSKMLWHTANGMVSSGLIYKYLDEENLMKLQTVYANFSFGAQDFINKQVKEHTANFNKQEADRNADYWENKFKENKKDLQIILDKLPKA